MRRVAAFVVVVGLLGCGGERTPASRALEFEACDVVAGAVCARVVVPRVRADKASGNVELFVAKLPAVGLPRAQVWLLAGGPGTAGATLETTARAIQRQAPDVEVLMPDHRGTGRSTRLGCPVEEAPGSDGGTAITAGEWDACITDLVARWSPALRGFDVAEAATDLAELIDATRVPGVEVVVYGRSYGTYLAQLLLAHHDVVDGVILDSSVPPDGSFVDYDASRDAVGRELMAACAADAACAARLDGAPDRALDRLWQQIADGHCAALGTPDTIHSVLRNMLGVLLDGGSERALIPAIIYRALRCTPADRAALVHIHNAIGAAASASGNRVFATPEPTTSVALFNHIALSELWPATAPDLAQARVIAGNARFSTDMGPRLAALADRWPRYPVPTDHGRYPATETPLVILTGTLDASTPIAWSRTMAVHYRGAHQLAIELPHGPHGLAGRTPTRDGKDCALALILQFIHDPRADIDASCVTRLVPLDLEGSSTLALGAFGVPSMWD